MNWRWLLLDYVDPQLPLTPKQRRRIWWKVKDVAWRKQKAIASLLPKSDRILFVAQALAPGVCTFGPLVVWMLYFRGATPTGILPAMLPVTLGLPVTWVITTWLGRFTWKRHVNIALREMGYDICPRCGYWLRGLAEHVEKCPECGTIRVPFLPMEHPAS